MIAEISRATNAEGVLTTSIATKKRTNADAETTDRTNADANAITTNLNAETTDRTNADATLN